MLLNVRFNKLNKAISFLQDGFIDFGSTFVILASHWIIELDIVIRNVTGTGAAPNFDLLVTGLGILTAREWLLTTYLKCNRCVSGRIPIL